EQLELMTAWPNLPQECWELAAQCDGLMRLLDEAVFSKSLPRETYWQRAMALILAKAADDSRSVIRLSKGGYGQQAAGLCRSIVEGAINALYIEKDPERRGRAFLHSMQSQNTLLIKRLSLHPVHEQLREAIEQVQRLEKEIEWPQNVRDRAYKVEEPNYSYDVVFLMLSQLLHSNVAALAGKLDLSDQEQFRIR